MDGDRSKVTKKNLKMNLLKSEWNVIYSKAKLISHLILIEIKFNYLKTLTLFITFKNITRSISLH